MVEFTFASIMEELITPLTVVAGLLGNSLSICVLRKKEIQLRSSFSRILIALAVFDITFIACSGAIFPLRDLWPSYRINVYPYLVPVLVPLAQITMTASVYTTVVTCFDRYITICQPALQGCCGRSEDTTSWCLIIGTAVFSVIYNFSRFFEYRVQVVTNTFTEVRTDPESGQNMSVAFNVSKVEAVATSLRMDASYIQNYILITNFVFMGLFPMAIMIIFNVLVVRAVNEANRKRARMTQRQRRNITVTSMLVSVVVVFLVCHSFKLILNGYEVYDTMISSSSATESSESSESPNDLEAMLPAVEVMTESKAYASMLDTAMPEYIPGDMMVSNHSNSSDSSINPNLIRIRTSGTNRTFFYEDHEPVNQWPVWTQYLTIVSHWLLILNSSCNIIIYLHKDPKFKSVFGALMVSWVPSCLKAWMENNTCMAAFAESFADDLYLDEDGCDPDGGHSQVPRSAVRRTIRRLRLLSIPLDNLRRNSQQPEADRCEREALAAQDESNGRLEPLNMAQPPASATSGGHPEAGPDQGLVKDSSHRDQLLLNNDARIGEAGMMEVVHVHISNNGNGSC